MYHSKEPWWFKKNALKDGEYEIRNGISGLAAFAPIARVRGDKRITGGNGMADARRIVACVNACAGLDTELLENIVMLGDTLLSRIEALKKEANNGH